MKQYIITEDMLRQWRKGCTNVSGSYCACKKCEYCGTGLREDCCDFDDNAMEEIFRSHPYQSELDTVLILLEKWMESEVKDIDENGEGIWSKNDVIDRLQRTWEKIAELRQAGEP